MDVLRNVGRQNLEDASWYRLISWESRFISSEVVCAFVTLCFWGASLLFCLIARDVFIFDAFRFCLLNYIAVICWKLAVDSVPITCGIIYGKREANAQNSWEKCHRAPKIDETLWICLRTCHESTNVEVPNKKWKKNLLCAGLPPLPRLVRPTYTKRCWRGRPELLERVTRHTHTLGSIYFPSFKAKYDTSKYSVSFVTLNGIMTSPRRAWIIHGWMGYEHRQNTVQNMGGVNVI